QGEGGFTADDEKLLRILAAQVGRIYENGSLYRQVSGHALELEVEIVARERAQRHLSSQYEVARILGEAVSFDEVALKVLQAICAKLDFAAGALWKVDEPGGVLRCLGAWCQPTELCGEWVAKTCRMVLEPDRGAPGNVWSSRR
ncbi:hypothetical protein, partial [Anoxybacillus sp. EFIL]